MAAQLPDGFALRPPVDGNGEAIVEMMNEESRALRGTVTVSLDWVANAWTAPGVDRENDFVVVVDSDGAVAGYVFVESHAPFTEVFSVGSVALRHQGRGIGAAILEEAHRRAARFFPLAPPGERIVMHAGALADEPRAAGLLTAHGFFEARRYARMAIEFAEPPALSGPIPEIGIRPFQPGDERAVYDCLSEAFADHWGGNWPSEESWRQRLHRRQQRLPARAVAARMARRGPRRGAHRRGRRRRGPDHGPRLEHRRPAGLPAPRDR